MVAKVTVKEGLVADVWNDVRTSITLATVTPLSHFWGDKDIAAAGISAWVIVNYVDFELEVAY